MSILLTRDAPLKKFWVGMEYLEENKKAANACPMQIIKLNKKYYYDVIFLIETKR